MSTFEWIVVTIVAYFGWFVLGALWMRHKMGREQMDVTHEAGQERRASQRAAYALGYDRGVQDGRRAGEREQL